ncbi:Gag-pro-like protein [Cucumis melo var. makuwa]|uniref:Gag-pro-like protein n=1 Tax=Cucumis melo var. makuwa TaxID=1194695 RepID=A0A5A7SX54_CUCMM|nr:Gag-pro-like protein [Cucumis melo var. makuwa]
MTKILELLTAKRGNGVTGTSSHVEIDLNQTDDTPAFPLGFTPQMMSSPHLAEDGRKVSEDQGSKRRLEFLEERLGAIKDADVYMDVDALRLCLIADVIPPKFKTPDFEKYNGTMCPKSHLVMYYQKMSGYAHDDKLLIHCFEDSLVSPASRRCMHLDGSQVHGWKDLVDAFLKQYKYNIDMASNHLDL